MSYLGDRRFLKSDGFARDAPSTNPRCVIGQRTTPGGVVNPIVGRDKVVKSVGYVHSLTFPARRVRLHPVMMRMLLARVVASKPPGGHRT